MSNDFNDDPPTVVVIKGTAQQPIDSLNRVKIEISRWPYLNDPMGTMLAVFTVASLSWLFSMLFN